MVPSDFRLFLQEGVYKNQIIEYLCLIFYIQ